MDSSPIVWDLDGFGSTFSYFAQSSADDMRVVERIVGGFSSPIFGRRSVANSMATRLFWSQVQSCGVYSPRAPTTSSEGGWGGFGGSHHVLSMVGALRFKEG